MTCLVNTSSAKQPLFNPKEANLDYIINSLVDIGGTKDDHLLVIDTKVDNSYLLSLGIIPGGGLSLAY